jgi:peroxiredoxin
MFPRRVLVALLPALFALPSAVGADVVQPGRELPDVTLPVAHGGTARVLDGAAAVTALVFFRDGNERSVDTLRMLASCRARVARDPVRLVGVVSPESAGAASGLARSSGLDLPVLVDTEETLYAAAGVRTLPAIVLVDRARRVVAVEPFHQVDYCDVFVARVQQALGKLTDDEVATALAPDATRLPGANAPADVAHRHLSLARRLLAARSFDQAHLNVRRALVLAPSAEAWRVEGEVFAAEGKCPAAVRAFDSALTLDPEDAGASAGRRACRR